MIRPKRPASGVERPGLFLDNDLARPYQDPDTWLQVTAEHPGSWWPRWELWLAERSGERVAPPPTPACLAPAPGTYVLAR